MFLTALGLTAAALTVLAFLPQVAKTLKTRRTHDLSLPMWLVLATAALLWTIYGILKSDIALIIANSIVCVSALTVLAYKIKLG